jgi:hypothetical protein
MRKFYSWVAAFFARGEEIQKLGQAFVNKRIYIPENEEMIIYLSDN